MAGKIQFIEEFRATAHQLRTYAIAGRWVRLRDEVPTLTAQEAAAWADLGYLPEDTWSLQQQVDYGVTAAMAREMEDHAEERAGGPEALAAMRVAELLAQDGMYGPDDAVTVQDPADPRREIVMLRDDLDGGEGRA